MIWDSIFLTTIIDILFIVAPAYLFIIAKKHYSEIKSLRITTGANYILAGLLVVATLSLIDLSIIYLFPLLTSKQDAIAMLTSMHLNWSLVIVLIGIAAIVAGLSYFLNTLIPRAHIAINNFDQEIDNRTEEIQKLMLSVEHSPIVIMITDTDLHIEYVNPKFTEVTGYTADEVLGHQPTILFAKDTQPEIYKELWETLLKGKEWRGEFLNKKKNGKYYWADQTIFPIFNDDGDIIHFVGYHEDITESKKISAQLSFQATHDQLTSLTNRLEFEKRLERVLISAKENDSEHVLCLLDLDQFKEINDTSGHVAGDELLRQLGALFRDNIRQRDTIGRLGGDEFGIIMEHCPLDKAYNIAEALRTTIEKFSFLWKEKSYSIGVSIGIATITADTQDMTEVMRRADAACYAAKEAGKNRVRIYRDDDATLAQRQDEIYWVPEINAALDEDRFQLFAQFIQPIGHHRQEGARYEILVRLKNRQNKMDIPGAFLPAAEKYNLSTKIDRWVIDHVFKWYAENPYFINEIESFSINLSGSSLGEDDLLQHIAHQFKTNNLPPSKISFEIAETSVIANLKEATHFISRLHSIGCSIALDDFGSALSSFGYLEKLPVSILKIDGMFVRDIARDKADYAMVNMINDLGHNMHMRTVAEYVESESILNKLKVIGVDYAQGYSIGRPEPIDMILKK